MPNASELRELDDEELESRLAEYRREMLNLRFQLATGQLDNIVRISVVRKDVARVLTIQRDREIALAEGRDASPVPATRPRRRPVEDVEVADVEVADEETPVRRPRKPRAQSVDEVSDTVDDGDVEVDDGDDVVDEEDE
jgi:large subunit ribosomal protein L29